jgi:cell division protein FtsQ
VPGPGGIDFLLTGPAGAGLQKKNILMSDSEHMHDVPVSPGAGSGEAHEGFPASPQGRGNWKAVLVVLLAVFIGLAGLAFHASRWKREVVVREVVIEGARIVSRKALSLSLDGYIGKNLQDIDAGALSRKLLRIPYVKSIELNRELNGILRVRVVEREPRALTLFHNRRMVIDSEGVLLPETPAVATRFPGLIWLSGITRTADAGYGLKKLSPADSSLVMDLAAALRQSDYAGLLIREIHVDRGGMTFCKATGSTTRFIVGSDGNFKEKLKKFEIFWQKVVSKKGLDNFHTVDLRFRDRIFTRDSVAPEIQQQLPLR